MNQRGVTAGQNRVVQGTGTAPVNNEAAANELARAGLEYGKHAMTVYREADIELYNIITDVPRLSGVWPYVCAILNLVLPGTGTMISSCLGYTVSWSKTQLTVGFLQMLTAVYLVGWIWSIYWAYLILVRGMQDKQEVKNFLNKTNARSEAPAQPR